MQVPPHSIPSLSARDFASGFVVFLVALPLCLGIALASQAPLFSGVVAGIVGGILVGALSGSNASVSGPAAGLATVVAAQIAVLGSFPAFLLAVVIAGLIQMAIGLTGLGTIAAFFPSGVIKGLLAAIGVILILKQIPHLLGHDPDPEGEMAFVQPDHESTFSELARLFPDIQPGAALIGLGSLALLILWGRSNSLKSYVPAPLAVVVLGVTGSLALGSIGGRWTIDPSHLVQVPVANGLGSFLDLFVLPDFSQWANPAVYSAALTIAAAAALQTLLTLEAVEKLDPLRRNASHSRELLAQGAGTAVSGMLGGLPVIAEIVRGSVNINAGARTRVSTIVHGVLLLVSVAFVPHWLNRIPLSCLAAILLVTGVKLISPALIRQMWSQGRSQFLPFAATVLSIIFTDLLTGVLIGLAVSVAFILLSNVRRPLRRTIEKHLGTEVVHIELANQVSFLNRAALDRALDAIPRGGHLLLDAQSTNYIDPDVLALIRDYKEVTAPARGVQVSLTGFRDQYHLRDQTQFVDYSTRDLQDAMTPAQVLEILRQGHDRFLTGRRLSRDLGRQVDATASAQHPLAIILGCIDSRAPAELIFDAGLGDLFSVRVAGNVTGRKVLGSLEYGCAVAGAKLIVVLGHTRCGAVTAAVGRACGDASPDPQTPDHLSSIVRDVEHSIGPDERRQVIQLSPVEKQAFVDDVARRNVSRVVSSILQESPSIRDLADSGRIAIIGALYDVVTGGLEFLPVSEPGFASVDVLNGPL